MMAPEMIKTSLSQDGDAVLVLDTGTELPVYSVLLELRSKELNEALELATARRTSQEQGQLRVPLPSTSDEEEEGHLQHLQHTVVYSQSPETLLLNLDGLQLLALARMCHRFAFEQLLTMVDKVGGVHTWAILSVSAWSCLEQGTC